MVITMTQETETTIDEAVHTYTVIVKRMGEYTDPKAAAEEMNEFMRTYHEKAVGDADRPIFEVRQFVDTDKPDKVVWVDSLDFKVFTDEGLTNEDTPIYKAAQTITPSFYLHVHVQDKEVVAAIEDQRVADLFFPINEHKSLYWANVHDLRDALHNDPEVETCMGFWPVAVLRKLADRAHDMQATVLHIQVTL